MSSVRLKKPYGAHQPPAVVSVPFGVGQRLVADGVAEYPDHPAAKKPAPAPTAADLHAAELQRRDAAHAQALAAVRAESDAVLKQLQADHAAELAKLRADLDAAKAAAAEPQSKPKK